MEESPGSESGEVRGTGSRTGRRQGPTSSDLNQVELRGKVSRSHGLRYSPSGEPLLEFLLAVPQKLWKAEIGYYWILVRGSQAEDWAPQVRIGKVVQVAGALWSRKFKNRQGNLLQEVKVVASHVSLGVQ